MRSILLLVLLPGLAVQSLSGQASGIPDRFPDIRALTARVAAGQSWQPVRGSAGTSRTEALAALKAIGQAQGGEAPAGSSENGKKLFVDRGCWQCHGLAAQGGGIAGPRLAGRVPAWPAFSRAVRRPIEEMVPYTEKMLPNTELADIYAWLKAIPPPPAVTSLPQLGR